MCLFDKFLITKPLNLECKDASLLIFLGVHQF